MGHPICILNIVYMTAGKCRGPTSSNGIELSWFIKFYCIFIDLNPLALGEGQVGAGGWAVSRSVGGCTHMHTCTCTCKEIANGHNMFIMMRHPPHGWVCGWLGGSLGQLVRPGQITNNLINLDIIEIIQLCMKIYDL